MADQGQRRGGKIQVQLDGEILDAKGNWTYNLGRPKREAIVGADRMHGFKEMPQTPFIEGEITDRGTLDLDAVVKGKGQTVTLTLANGKAIVLHDAWYAGDGTGNTEEGNVAVRWEGMDCDEVA